MTNWYEGTDNVVTGTAVTLGATDHLYVKAGVAVGSSQAADGVATAGIGTVSTIYGDVLSLGGIGFHSAWDVTYIAIGAGGSVSGGVAAIRLEGNENSIVNDGSISGVNGVLIVSVAGANSLINTGQIIGRANAAVYMSGGDNFISNSGALSAPYNNAVRLDSTIDDGANTIDNSGTITARIGFNAIQTGDAQATVTNSGHIVGNILFGVGDDSYDGSLGSTVGDISGGDGDDTLTGGAGRDRLIGGDGADTLDGNGGRDRFIYTGVAESGGMSHDTILGYDARADLFDLDVAVTNIDAIVATGKLREGHFNNDMAAAVAAANLGAHHAVLFTPDTGDLAGHTFLIVDANGTAGYQAHQDYVFDLSDPDHLTDLGVSDFI